MVTRERGKEAGMQGELFYGNDGLSDWNDSDASGKPYSPAFGQQEGKQIEENKDTTPHLDINNSNTNLDKYLFYFSSKL